MFRLNDAEHVVSATCIEDYEDEDTAQEEETAENADSITPAETTGENNA